MTTKNQIFPSQPYKGTRDFYPLDLKKRNYIFSTWKQTLNSLGFVEYETSVIENADLYIAKSGEELGSKQLYNFYDKSNRHIALRPEQTPSLARLVANKFGELNFPLRWFSIPNCFRYERPQKGRLREHWQLNVDIIGLPAGEAEIELMNVLGKIFLGFKATKKNFKIMYNHRQVLDEWLKKNQFFEIKEIIYKVLDDWFKEDLKTKTEVLSNAGLDQSQIKLIEDLTKKQGFSWEQYLDLAKEYSELDLLLNLLPQIRPEVEYEFNPCIIRGIAYYTGIVLEAFDKNPANPRALFGGGRYDNLMELFGKQSPAIGFGWGDVTMHEFLTNWNLYPDFEKKSKLGILPNSRQNLKEIYLNILPKLESENKSFEIDYDFHRSENKRYQGLKKRGAVNIIKVGFEE